MREVDDAAAAMDHLAVAVKTSAGVREWIQAQRDTAHAAGRLAGALEVIDWAIREIQERLARTGPYDDTRPYTEFLVALADKRRDPM